MVLLTSKLLYDSLIFTDSPTTVSDLVGLRKIIVSTGGMRIGQDDIPLAVSIVSQRRVRTDDRSTLLPMLSRRIPKLFIARGKVANFKISRKTTNAIGVHNIKDKGGILVLFSKRPR